MSRTLGFTPRDAAGVRFGTSCTWEVLTSVRVLREPASHEVHLSWVRAVRPQIETYLASADAGAVDAFALLGDLVGSGARRDYAPDLLTPAPTSTTPSLAAELDVLRATPGSVVRAQLDHLRDRWTPRLEALHHEPVGGLERLAQAVSAYWEIALAPFWARITAVTDAELFLRGRELVSDGTAALLGDLHERVVWDGRSLTVHGTSCLGEEELAGGGLCLVPSVFVWPSVLVVAGRGTAQLAFPCRGTGTLWAEDPAGPQALRHLVGRSKADLLALLDTPLSTSAAAARLGLGVSTASEHLTALRAAGLVRTRRSGQHSLHLRTSAADALLAASSWT